MTCGRFRVKPGMRKGEAWAYTRLPLARLGERKRPETCREACWSTAGGTKTARNVPRGVLQDFSTRWRSVEMTRGGAFWKIPGRARNEERGGLGLCAFALSTAGGTKTARNVPRGVLEHGWGNENGPKRAARRATRFLHSLALGRNDKRSVLRDSRSSRE